MKSFPFPHFIFVSCLVSVIFFKDKAALSIETKTKVPAPEKISEAAPAHNMEKVIQTLNETLVENKTFRQKTIDAEKELDNVKTQSNLLMSQVRKLQADLESAKREGEGKTNEALKELDQKKKEMEAFDKEKEKFHEEQTEAEKKNEAILQENTRLQELLNTSILESERNQYVTLLKEADRSAKHALFEFAKTKKENEKFKSELDLQYYSLGNLFFEQQNYKEAIRQYQKAVKLNPNDSWAHHNLGVIYDFYVSDDKKALYHYKKYLRLKPIEEDAREIRERVLHLGIGKHVVPRFPLKTDFRKYQQDVKLK